MRPIGLILFAVLGVSGCQQNDAFDVGKRGPYKGDLTWNDVGLGACGVWSENSDLVCAVSHVLFDAVATSSNPNENPLCQVGLQLHHEGKRVNVRVVDRCVGCGETDIDVSPGVFEKLSNLDQGRISVSWQWNEHPPGGI